MSTHTLGPWMAASESANGRLPIVSQANGRSVGTVSWFGSMPDGFKSHERECHANARLIASSPDMLAALQDLYSFVAVMIGSGPDAVIPETITTPIGLPVKIGEIMRDAEAAILKSGSQP